MLLRRPKHTVLSFRRMNILSPMISFHSMKKHNVAASNSLISRLSKCGRIFDARKVFDEMRDRDVITWTALIAGYVKCGMVEEARELFDSADAMKDVITWTVMVNGFARSKRIEEAERIFLEMPERNAVSWNTMMEGYALNGLVDSALALFEAMPEKNVVSWNTIITTLVQSGRVDDAWWHFDSMPERNVVSWTTMVAGLSRNGKIDEARRVFDRMPERNVVSWNAMVAGYVRNGRLGEAFELFETMPVRNASSWNAMISGFIQYGEVNEALRLFDEMPRKDLISWSSMISGYTQCGRYEEALKMFSNMVAEEKMRPNETTFASALSACSNLVGLVEGQQVHQMISKTVHQGSEILISALINLYSKCGQLRNARKMFDYGLVSRRDLISWNGMISAYAHHGCGTEAIDLFNQLRKLGFRPNDVTYVGLLSACSHAGLVYEGLSYFDELVRDGSIEIREEHYTCYVDLCGRAGKLKQAFDFIERLETKQSQTMWGVLLAGCNLHGDTCIGKLVEKRVLEGGAKEVGTYSLLSNLYASSGKWKEAAKVRLKMKERGLKKQPGCSWIEVGNTVHVFVVGDRSNLQANMVFPLLSDLHKQMKKIWFVSSCDTISDGDT